MLRIVNPGLGRALMVENPGRRRRRRRGKRRQSGILLRASSFRKAYRPRRRRYAKPRNYRPLGRGYRMLITSRRRRRSHGGGRRRRNFSLAVHATPATRILPNLNEMQDEAVTVAVGTGAFVANHALGVGVNKILEMIDNASPGFIGKLDAKIIGAAKFAARYLGARALSSMVFKESTGVLSKANGALIKQIVVISGGIALLRDLGLLDWLGQYAAYIPQLGYAPGAMTDLTRMGIEGYTDGTPRSLAGYEENQGGSNWGGVAGYENAAGGGYQLGYVPSEANPVETMQVPTYGVPFGH